MMDHQFISQNRARVERSLKERGDDFDLSRADTLDKKRKDLQTKHDQEKAKLNELSKQIGQIYQEKGDPKQAEALKEQSSFLKSEIQALSEAMEKVQGELMDMILYMPNVLHESVVSGQSELDNPEVRTWGKIPKIPTPQTHEDLAQSLGMLELEKAATISGARFSFLTGWGARLERALVQLMLDTHREHGYTEISSPLLVHDKAMQGTGQLPKFEEDAFFIESTKHYLIPTAEVPLTNFYRESFIDAQALPIKFVSDTPCFRKEAGSYGKDTKGLIRQHQFRKVELVQFVDPDQSYAALEELTNHAEAILQKLELPYRVVSLCAGDIGFSAAKTYDIEVWLPAQDQYREISSCSNFEDFQARRADIKCKRDGKNIYVHTLNGSGLAVGRTLVALLENHQQPDGSIKIPAALAPYLGTDHIKKG